MKNKTSFRLSDNQKAILQILADIGTLSVALIAPNALQILKVRSNNKHYHYKKTYIKNKVLRKMSERGLICIEERQGTSFARITSKGKEVLRKKTYSGVIPRNKKWDKKWRIIVYDISEKYEGKRNLLRQALQRVGFKKIQGSVWVFPYECRQFLSLLRADLNLDKEIVYLETSFIENEEQILSWFKIKK
tara:strand:- start:374 stop:943 length:570 start_codon:yes stop_codon:yes gene_type:complete